MNIKTSVKFGPLKKLVEEMSKQYSVKVGLLADKGGVDPVGEDIDLAGLGAVHEFGCDIKITPKMAAYLAIKAKELGLPSKQGKGDGYVHIPARSFLQGSLTHKNEILKELKSRVGIEELIEYIGQTGDMESLATMLGAAGVAVVQKGFETGGFGQWTPDSPLTIAAKKSAMPLIDEGYLSSHIDFEVEKKNG